MPPRARKTPIKDEPKTGLGAIEFLEDGEEPPETKKFDRDDEFWRNVKSILEMKPQTWAKVKVFDKPDSAAQRASIINRNKNKLFPCDKFEARYSKDETTSTLFLRAK